MKLSASGFTEQNAAQIFIERVLPKGCFVLSSGSLSVMTKKAIRGWLPASRRV